MDVVHQVIVPQLRQLLYFALNVFQVGEAVWIEEGLAFVSARRRGQPVNLKESGKRKEVGNAQIGTSPPLGELKGALVGSDEGGTLAATSLRLKMPS